MSQIDQHAGTKLVWIALTPKGVMELSLGGVLQTRNRRPMTREVDGEIQYAIYARDIDKVKPAYRTGGDSVITL